MSNEVKKTLRSFLKWNNFRTIPHTTTARSMYLWFVVVPIIAKALSKTNETVTFAFHNSEFTLHLRLPFSWQVFYFSALFFVAGNILFSIFCPKIIQDHASYKEFENAGRTRLHLHGYASQIGITLEEQPSLDHYPIELRKEIVDDYLRDTFWNIYGTANRSRRFFLYFCAASYSLGFCGLIYVALMNLWFVLKLLV